MTNGSHTERFVEAAISRLHTAARDIEAGWVAHEWTRVNDDGKASTVSMNVESIHFRQVGVFQDFALEPNRAVDFTVELELPEEMFGTRLVGEPLQLTINSLRPVDILLDEVRVFHDELPVVASGPAYIELLEEIRPGGNGLLRLRVLGAPVPLDGEWGRTGLTLQFTSPSLRARWRLLDMAHAKLLLAREFAQTPERAESVRRASQNVPDDLTTLSNGQLEQLFFADGACGGGPSIESWLDSALADFRIHCVGHSHIDLAWLWTYEDTREVIFRDMTSVLSLFDDYPEFRFTHSQASSYAEVQKSRPELFERILQRVREHRLEPATMQWVEADANLPSGASQTRQLLEGVSYSRTHLHYSPTVFLAPDTFGHSGNLPQLAVQAGATVYYHHRANPGFVARKGYWQAYWWIGDDGTRLLAVGTPVYLGPVSATRLAQDLITLGKRNGITEVCYFYGVGDHGGGPTRADLDYIRILNAASCFPRVECSTVSNYADALIATTPELPEVRGETERVFEGCYVTHADSKSMNRASENALIAAESLATLAGIDESAQLSSLWRGVLHHQFHDILGGSAVAGAFVNQAEDTNKALEFASELSSRALAELRSGMPEGSLAVTSALGSPRRDMVVVPEGDRGRASGIRNSAGQQLRSQISAEGELIFITDVGSFGTAEFHFDNSLFVDDRLISASIGVAWTGEPTIELKTPFYRAELRTFSGIVTSLVDVSSGSQLVGRSKGSPESLRQLRPDLGLGALVETHELAHPMSSWVSDELVSERVLTGSAKTRIVEQGPVRIVIETTHQAEFFDVVVKTSFYSELPWIDYQVEVDWRAFGSAQAGIPGLEISFGTRKRAADLWTEGPFSAVRREPDGFLSPMLRWADLGSCDGGLAVANSSKYGVDALGPRLRVHLLRSAYEPDPRSDAGRIDTSHFRVLPHGGPWFEAGVVGMAAALNSPLFVGIVQSIVLGKSNSLSPHPFLVKADTVAISGLGRDGDQYIVRLYETSGHSAEVVVGGLPLNSTVFEETIVAKTTAIHQVRGDGTISLRFHEFELKSLRVSSGQA